jgi:hypothetical protein
MIRYAFLLFPLAAVVSAGCGSEPDASSDDIGEARAAITQVPGDVHCVQVSVVGASRTTTRQFDVTPGQSSVLDMKGLPIGADTFKGSAFDSACSGVMGSTNPTWVGDDVQATLSAGVIANVKIVLRHNGEANVSVDFQGDDGGVTCPMGQTLCNGQCVNTATDSNNCGACGQACTAPNTCGGGGTPGVCGCTDDGTACQGQVCGSAVNNCGKSVICGVCNGHCCFDSCVCSNCACP